MTSVSRNACWSKPSALPTRPRRPFGEGLLPPDEPPFCLVSADAPLPFVEQLRRAWHSLHGEWIEVEAARGIIRNLRELGLDAKGVPLADTSAPRARCKCKSKRPPVVSAAVAASLWPAWTDRPLRGRARRHDRRKPRDEGGGPWLT